jgi:hypothetical protein
MTPSAGPLPSASAPPAGTHLSVSTSSQGQRPLLAAEGRTPSALELESSVLANSRIEGEGVLLSWQADDKAFVSLHPLRCLVLLSTSLTKALPTRYCFPQRLPVEACFRSLMLVLLDNASSEYTFLVRFFSPPPPMSSSAGGTPRLARLLSSFSQGAGGGEDGPVPAARDRFGSLASTVGGRTERLPSTVTLGGGLRERQPSYIGGMPALVEGDGRSGEGSAAAGKEERKEMEALFAMAFDPALEYVQVRLIERKLPVTKLTHFASALQAQITALLTPMPSPPHLLSLLSLLGALLSAAQTRGITPLEPFLIKQRLALWPLFQKRIDDEAAGLKALAERAAPGGGGLMGMVTGVSGSKVKDAKVQKVRLAADEGSLSLEGLMSLFARPDCRAVYVDVQRAHRSLVRGGRADDPHVVSLSRGFASSQKLADILHPWLQAGPSPNAA